MVRAGSRADIEKNSFQAADIQRGGTCPIFVSIITRFVPLVWCPKRRFVYRRRRVVAYRRDLRLIMRQQYIIIMFYSYFVLDLLPTVRCMHATLLLSVFSSLSTKLTETCRYSYINARCNIYISRLSGSALAHYSWFRFQIPIPIYRALRSRCMRARALNYLYSSVGAREGIIAGKIGGIISRYASNC